MRRPEEIEDGNGEMPGFVWLAKSLRVTAFPTAPNPIEEIWEELLGDAPDQRDGRPRERTLREIGTFGNNRLEIFQRPNRIDFLLNAAPRIAQEVDVQFLGPGDQTLGAFNDVETEFSGLVRNWLEGGPDLQRLAYSPILVHDMGRAEEALPYFEYVLPNVNFENSNVQDFVFQINKPLASTSLDDLNINRLIKWEMLHKILLEIQLNPQPVQTFVNGPDGYILQMTLDFNTVPTSGQNFERNIAVQILDETIDMINEMVGEGDIA